MLLSRSAHEQGSALARPVTVRSAGAVPAPHEAPEPLRRFERIGEVRCYSRLNVGRHQVGTAPADLTVTGLAKALPYSWGRAGEQHWVPPRNKSLPRSGA